MHLILDRSVLSSDDALLSAVDAAVTGGVDAVHLRDPSGAAADLLTFGRALRSLVDARAMLVVNDRVDVALALGADAVQLGARSLPIADVRRIAPHLLIGSSVHSAAEAQLVAEAGSDWLIVGTIFPSQSHPGRPGAGPALIASVREVADRPVIGIGGVTSANAAAVIQAGGHGVAVVSAILGASSPRAGAAALRAALADAEANADS